MSKSKIQFTKKLIVELESTILNRNNQYVSHTENILNTQVFDIDYQKLLFNEKLVPDLISEIGFVIQTYGDELLYVINENCSPKSLSERISIFIYEKEKHRLKALIKKLNSYTDLEDISQYRLSDYITLGFSFYDSLFFAYMNRYQICYYNVWNLVSNTEYEKPLYLKQTNNIESISKTKVKNKPNKHNL